MCIISGVEKIANKLPYNFGSKLHVADQIKDENVSFSCFVNGILKLNLEGQIHYMYLTSGLRVFHLLDLSMSLSKSK